MTQSSAPIVGVNLSDTDWRDFGLGEAGVVSDLNGSAYALALSPNSDVAAIGSTTQRSIAHVANFRHLIPSGEAEQLTIPPASGTARTDIIALRYDPAFTGAPGPVRLVVITGTSSGLPVYDDAPPGIEDLPLWAVTRQPGQSLAQATKRQLFSRLAPHIDLAAEANLPSSSPLGTTASRAGVTYTRQLDTSGVPAWVAPVVSAALVKVTGATLATQSIASSESAPVVVKFNQVERADTTLFSYSTTTGELTCVKAGWYDIGSMVTLQGSTTLDDGQQRFIGLYRNSTQCNVAQGSLVPVAGKQNSQILLAPPGPIELVIGDKVTVRVLQDSGVTQTARLYQSYMSARFLGR